MTRLDRYVAAMIARDFLLALAVLLGIFSVVNFMEEIEKAGTASYGLRQAVWFVVMTLPAEAYRLSPAAALLGSVNALGSMASSHELVAIWAAGVSTARFVWAVMKAATLVVVGAFVLAEFVAIPLARRAEVARSLALSGSPALSTAEGLWMRDRSRFINVRDTLPGPQLRDVYVYEFDDRHRMRSFTYAKAVSYTGHGWRVEGVIEGVITGDGVTTRRIPATVWDSFVSSRELETLFVAPEHTPLLGLFRAVTSLRDRGEGSLRYELVLWKRLAMPLVTAVMVFLAIPFVLRGLGAAKAGTRTVAGALAGIGFQIFNQTFARFGLVYGLPPFFGALFPAALVLALGLWLLSRPE